MSDKKQNSDRETRDNNHGELIKKGMTVSRVPEELKKPTSNQSQNDSSSAKAEDNK